MTVKLNLRNRLCVVVGAAEEGWRVCRALLEEEARLRAVWPLEAVPPRPAGPGVEWICAPYAASQLAGAFLVVAATGDSALNAQVARDARELPVLVLRTDAPEDSDLMPLAKADTAGWPVCAAGRAAAAPAKAPDLRATRSPAFPAESSARDGRVWIAGAGPGDPGLVTVKAAEALALADVVIHDGLVDPAVLDLYCPGAERIDVSKRKGCCRHLQDEIHAMMIELARAGRRVVRLKGGDPMIFGRGGEETRALAAAGIAHEVIPGVSSISAVPAAAGIPVTDRQYGAASVGVYSLHRRNGMPLDESEWRRMAEGPDTLILLMGKTQLGMIVAKLAQHGRAPSTPVAFIADGTTARQSVVAGTLADIAERVDVSAVPGPALIVVGEVARAASGAAPRSPSAACEGAPAAAPSLDGIEVLLIRHGEIGAQYDGRYVGRLDPPLSTAGIERASALRRHAELRRADLQCLASPSLRARQTAAAAGLAAELDEDLREIDFGRWEGLSFDEIAAADPEAVARWAQLDAGFLFPGGESLAEFDARIRRVAERLAEGAPRTVAVFTHKGVIRALICHWLGLPREAQLLLEIGHASLTRLRVSKGRATLCTLNDLCHAAEVVR